MSAPERSLAQTDVFPDVDSLTTICIQTSHRELCAATVESFRDDYVNARKGDYPAQRNVAFCLYDGCDGAVIVDRTEACAWRMVIQGTDVRKEQTERWSFENACFSLDPPAIREALVRAGAMFERIYRKKLDYDRIQ